MFVRFKKPEQYKGFFLDPENTVYQVYMEDKAGGDSYYMVKMDGPKAPDHKADHTMEIVWELDGIPWEGVKPGRRAKGFMNIVGKDVEIVEVDNEGIHSMLPSMEAFV